MKLEKVSLTMEPESCQMIKLRVPLTVNQETIQKNHQVNLALVVGPEDYRQDYQSANVVGLNTSHQYVNIVIKIKISIDKYFLSCNLSFG